jgi:hypothetical protein
MKCKDCQEDGASVHDQWETFEGIPLCGQCIDERYEERVSAGVFMPSDWRIDLDR